MRLSQAQLKKVTWVMCDMASKDTFATCTRCNVSLPKPKMPCPIDAALFYFDYVLAFHADCKEPVNA